MCGPHFCSMRITEDVRKYAAQQGLDEDAAIKRGLGTFLRQGLVVELARGFGIEREIELILPTEFEARFGDRVIAVLRAGMAFR